MKALLAALIMSTLATPAAFAQAYTSEELGQSSIEQQTQTNESMNFDFEMAFPGRGGPGRGGPGGGHGGGHGGGGFPGGPGRGPGGPGHGGPGFPGHGPRPPGPGPRPMPPRPYPYPRPPRPYPAPRPYPGGQYWTCEYRDAQNFQYIWQDWDINQARWNAQNECLSRTYSGGCYELRCY